LVEWGVIIGLMIKDEMRISIVVYGEIESGPAKWWEWYLYARAFNARIGRNPDFAGITGDSFQVGRVLTLAGADKELKKSVERGDRFQYISLYAMPEHSRQAGFDHLTYMLRTCFSQPNRILVTLFQEDYLKLNADQVIGELKQFIRFSSGQVFEMAISESPFGYVMQAHPAAHYKTLKIIKDL
jgi:hypothetical protein